jgi:hypothetical protein
MSKLLVRSHAPDADGSILEVTPESAGWTHVGFQVVKLAAGETYDGSEPSRETCVVVMSGTAEVSAEGASFGKIGGRASVFEDRAPGAVYVPATAPFSVTAVTDIELALCTAPGRPGGQARLIAEGDMPREVRGKGTNVRHVRNILPETATADGLLVVEVITPGGHWSSYPPHKHDTADRGRGDGAGGDLLSPPEPAAGLRLPARLHRRSQPGRDGLRAGRRRGDGAARLSPGRRPARLRPLLPQRHGRTAPEVDLPQRPGPRLDHASSLIRYSE